MNDSRNFVKKVMDLYGNQEKYFLCGISLGGLTSYALSFEKPELFTGCILMSPALKI